ncbi:uncharacterized protein LOC114599439 isoform X3 [Podarcis muralis]
MASKRQDKMRISRKQGILLLAGYMTYIVMGALVIELLENDHHERLEEATFRMKAQFFSNYTALSPEEVEVFIQAMETSVPKQQMDRSFVLFLLSLESPSTLSA